MSCKKILVVDDNPVILKALDLKLRSSGYEVLSAVDGSEAVRLARHEKPDLILLDISFPPDVAHGGGVGWDGFLIMDWLRRIDESTRIPVIVITGSDPAMYEKKALAAGAIAFFRKPVDHDELLEVIRKTLREPAATSA